MKLIKNEELDKECRDVLETALSNKESLDCIIIAFKDENGECQILHSAMSLSDMCLLSKLIDGYVLENV